MTQNLIKAIMNNKQLPIPKYYSGALNTLIDLLLEKNPNLRPSIAKVVEIDYIKMNISKFQSSSLFNEFQSKFGRIKSDSPVIL